jgi:hypothetical protein
MKSTALLTIILLSFRLADGQTVDAIRFVYRGQRDFLHPTLAICNGKLIQPNDIDFTDSRNGSAILTDTGTYNWVREYILSSIYTYSAKDAEIAKKVGKPMCPIETSLEMIDSGGMDLFVCRSDWGAFFDTLKSELRRQSLDHRVIDMLKSPPYWPMTKTSPTALRLHN